MRRDRRKGIRQSRSRVDARPVTIPIKKIVSVMAAPEEIILLQCFQSFWCENIKAGLFFDVLVIDEIKRNLQIVWRNKVSKSTLFQ